MDLNVKDIGLVKLRKLSNLDWEVIRNKSVYLDTETRTEKTNSGTFIKLMAILGINEAPFFKSKYPDKTRLSAIDFKEREDAYYFSGTQQKVFDAIHKEIVKYNRIDDSEIREVSKK